MLRTRTFFTLHLLSLFYDRPECLYIHDLAQLEAPNLSIPSMSCKYSSQHLGFCSLECNLF